MSVRTLDDEHVHYETFAKYIASRALRLALLVVSHEVIGDELT